MIHADDDIREAIREKAPKTTVERLAAKGIRRVRVVDMETLERLFERALERALERSLSRLPTAARRTFERDAREELREAVRYETSVRSEPEETKDSDPAIERKRALLELVFQENLVIQKRCA